MNNIDFLKRKENWETIKKISNNTGLQHKALIKKGNNQFNLIFGVKEPARSRITFKNPKTNNQKLKEIITNRKYAANIKLKKKYKLLKSNWNKIKSNSKLGGILFSQKNAINNNKIQERRTLINRVIKQYLSNLLGPKNTSFGNTNIPIKRSWRNLL